MRSFEATLRLHKLTFLMIGAELSQLEKSRFHFCRVEVFPVELFKYVEGLTPYISVRERAGAHNVDFCLTRLS